jgi:hypothetical protein
VLRFNGATGAPLGPFVSVGGPLSLAFGPGGDVPEPGTLLLIVCGIAGLGLLAPKQRKR